MRSSQAGWQRLRVAALAILLSAVPGRAIEYIEIIHNHQENPQQIREIYGNSNRPVKVYVKMYHDSPALLCTTQELSEKELVDPYFIWVGPSGRNIKGEPYVRISETGSLILKSFDKFMSGDYTCTVSYKDVDKNKELFLDMKFSFKSVEKELISDLTCRITDVEMRCHVVKIPHKGLITELFITFKVDPYGYGWEEVCKKFIHDCEDETNRRVEKARHRIEAFFKKQSVVLDKMKESLPTFYYIANSLNTKIKNSHTVCPNGEVKGVPVIAIVPHWNETVLQEEPYEKERSKIRSRLTLLQSTVVCDHGMYSPNNDVFCKPCTSVKINYYGATAC
ncbi:zona pellucida-binding protein 2-like [Cetorhinus maximus]